MNTKDKKTGGKKTANKETAGILGMIGAVAAAAVGAYYVYNSKDAKKKIKNVKGWVLKAKGEILDKLEDMKDVTEEKYKTTVDSILTKYNKVKKVEGPEIIKLGDELKKHWKTIVKEINASSKTIKKAAKDGAKIAKEVSKNK